MLRVIVATDNSLLAMLAAGPVSNSGGHHNMQIDEPLHAFNEYNNNHIPPPRFSLLVMHRPQP